MALVGGTGKLGTIIRAVINELEGFEVARVLTSSSDVSELDGVDLVVDASTPQVSIDVVRAAVERGINVLVGTSGWSAERIALVRPLVEAAGTGAVFIPNFSLGSVLGSALSAAAARSSRRRRSSRRTERPRSTLPAARQCAPPNSSPQRARSRVR